jgi:uncharacterized membrane protein
MTYLASYAAALVVFVISDMIWLGTMVSRFYRPILEEVLLPTVNLPAAIVFYLLYPLGLVIFAITPALRPARPRPLSSTARCSASSPTRPTISATLRR